MTAEPSTPLRRSPKERLPLLLSFCLPFLISGIALAVAGLYPFGNGQIMAHDGWHQYYPFFRAFREKLLTGGSLQYTWEVGAGTSYLSLFAYYLASPLNLLTVLVPAAYLRELFAFLTVLKLGLAGLFFGIYLKLVYRKNDLAIPFFSLLYAFCAWVRVLLESDVARCLCPPAAFNRGYGLPPARRKIPAVYLRAGAEPVV